MYKLWPIGLMMYSSTAIHNERRLPSKNYNRGKNGREKEKRKTENDDERGLHQIVLNSFLDFLPGHRHKTHSH